MSSDFVGDADAADSAAHLAEMIDDDVRPGGVVGETALEWRKRDPGLARDLLQPPRRDDGATQDTS